MDKSIKNDKRIGNSSQNTNTKTLREKIEITDRIEKSKFLAKYGVSVQIVETKNDFEMMITQLLGFADVENPKYLAVDFEWSSSAFPESNENKINI